MGKSAVINKVRKFARRVRGVYPYAQVVLFGSYARGTAHKDSDIDVAVVVDRTRRDHLRASSELFRLRRDIDVRIEPVLLERIHDESGFLEQILKTGIVVQAN
jgi:predicted nucleotidyltransferase